MRIERLFFSLVLFVLAVSFAPAAEEAKKDDVVDAEFTEVDDDKKKSA